jgi:hypothetical protein
VEGAVMRSSRAVPKVLAVVAWVLIGGWGVINLAAGDWFIGGLMLACALVGLWSLTLRVLRHRARR